MSSHYGTVVVNDPTLDVAVAHTAECRKAIEAMEVGLGTPIDMAPEVFASQCQVANVHVHVCVGRATRIDQEIQ